MNTKLFRILSFLLIVCMMFFAVSCGQSGKGNANSTDPDSAESPSETTTGESGNPGTQHPGVTDEQTAFEDKGANADPYGEFYTFVPPVLSAPD